MTDVQEPVTPTPSTSGRGRSAPTAPSKGLSLPVRVVISLVVVVIGYVVAPSLSREDLYIGAALLTWSLVASSLNIVVGYAGQLNLAQGGFLALGAYLGVLGTGRWEWNALLILVVAGVSAYVIASLLGRIIFRAKGLHFALLTTGISIVVFNILVTWGDVTGGSAGISTAGPIENGGINAPLNLLGLEIDAPEEWFRTMLICLVALVLVLSIVRRRKIGLSWQAIRDNEVLGASTGVDVVKGKRSAFVASSVLAALIGVLFGHWLGFITPSSFSFAEASFEPLAMVIIGGAGTLAGPIVGAIIITGLPEYVRDLDSVSTLVYGVILLLVVMLAPKGVVGLAKDAVRALRSRLTRKDPDA